VDFEVAEAAGGGGDDGRAKSGTSTKENDGGKRLAVVIVASACLGLPTLARAQTPSTPPAAAPAKGKAVSPQDVELMRKDIRSEKKQLVAQNLDLTPAEATKFWPIYDQYTAEAAKINDKKIAVIEEYAANQKTLTDERALVLVKQWQDADIAATQLLEKYIPIMAAVIGGKKAARFGQVDKRISLIVDLQIASDMPLVKSQ
jgi:hypothetical protein